MINREAFKEIPRFPTKQVEQGFVTHLVQKKMAIQAQIKLLFQEEEAINTQITALIARQKAS